MAMISILGLYNWDETIFDGFRTPENVDRDTTINNILLETAELEVIYSDPDTMKFAITQWTNKEFKVWEELQKTREYDYNPIWNKDGTILETETRDLARTESGSKDKTTTEDLSTISNKSGESDQNGTIENSVMGFNSTSYENKDKTETDIHGEYQDNDTITGDNEIVESETFGSEAADTGTIERERRETGNIGVTTTQTMIKEQREVVVFNTMDYIINSFKNRFCLLVY